MKSQKPGESGRPRRSWMSQSTKLAADDNEKIQEDKTNNNNKKHNLIVDNALALALSVRTHDPDSPRTLFSDNPTS